MHTLRVSEKRRPSCKDMSSVIEAASWMWEEADDGDIATASMGAGAKIPAPGSTKTPSPLVVGQPKQNPPRKEALVGGGGGGVAHLQYSTGRPWEGVEPPLPLLVVVVSPRSGPGSRWLGWKLLAAALAIGGARMDQGRGG